MKEFEGVFRPGELVEYQPGGIVSRMAVKKEKGTITLFAFDQGQGLSEHTAPFDALVHLLEGEAEIAVGPTRHRVRAGEMLRLPAHVPHAVRAPERFKMILTMIRE